MLKFTFPLKDEYRKISSPYGWRWIKLGDMTIPVRQFHKGEDHPCPIGTPGSTAYHGYISKIGTSLRAGLFLEITHSSCSTPEFSVKTVYYHLSKVNFRYLQQVTTDDVVFLTGNSGKWTTGPHLHWGVSVNDSFVDPSLVYDKLV